MSVIIECSFECIFLGKGKVCRFYLQKRFYLRSQPCFHNAKKPSASLSTKIELPNGISQKILNMGRY